MLDVATAVIIKYSRFIQETIVSIATQATIFFAAT